MGRCHWQWDHVEGGRNVREVEGGRSVRKTLAFSSPHLYTHLPSESPFSLPIFHSLTATSLRPGLHFTPLNSDTKVLFPSLAFVTYSTYLQLNIPYRYPLLICQASPYPHLSFPAFSPFANQSEEVVRPKTSPPQILPIPQFCSRFHLQNNLVHLKNNFQNDARRST